MGGYRGTSKERAYLILILAVALVLRLGYVISKPPPEIIEDSVHYDDIAVNFLNGKGLSLSDRYLLPGDRVPSGEARPTARRPPLYPIFLAAVYRIFGRDPRAVAIVQSFLSTATCYFLFLLGLAVSGRRRQALLVAALAAGYLPFLRFSHAVLTETLFLFLVILSFYFMLIALGKTGIAWSALAGGFSGASALCRPTATGLPFVFFFFLLLRLSRESRGLLSAKAGAYLLVFLIGTMPWVARNYKVFGSLVPGFTSAGYNLFVGSYPPSKGKANISLELYPPSLREELGGKGEIETNGILMRAALENVRSNPGGYAKLVAIKLLGGWFNIRDHHVWMPTWRSLIIHGVLLLLAFAGIVLGWSENTFKMAFVCSPIVYFTGFHALVVSGTRYNLPSVPFAMILASFAMEHIFHQSVHLVKGS